jgi:hypothetical protein
VGDSDRARTQLADHVGALGEVEHDPITRQLRTRVDPLSQDGAIHRRQHAQFQTKPKDGMMNHASVQGKCSTLFMRVRCAAFLAAFSLGGCSALNVPTAQSIQGLTPSGTVTVTETFVAGAGAGSGTLTYNGQNYPFRLIGSVMGPGGADRITASGEVYKLSNVSDFEGRYTQGSGRPGLSQGGQGQLWLQNGAGVIMHLYSTSSGILLSLGKEEIIIRLSS